MSIVRDTSGDTVASDVDPDLDFPLEIFVWSKPSDVSSLGWVVAINDGTNDVFGIEQQTTPGYRTRVRGDSHEQTPSEVDNVANDVWLLSRAFLDTDGIGGVLEHQTTKLGEVEETEKTDTLEDGQTLGPFDKVHLGDRAGSGQDFDGKIAEVAIYSAKQDGSVYSSMLAGMTADQLDQTDLVHYWPLRDNLINMVHGGENMTTSGTEFDAEDHPVHKAIGSVVGGLVGSLVGSPVGDTLSHK